MGLRWNPLGPRTVFMLTHFTDLDAELAIGSYPHAPEHVAFLVEAGVRSVENLQTDEDLGLRGVEWPFMWQLYTQHRILVSRVPVRDHAPQELTTSLEEAVTAIADHVRRGRKVYVHCTAGLNRSSTSLIAYLMAHRGMGLEEATKWLKDRHHCVPYPEVIQGWLAQRSD